MMRILYVSHFGGLGGAERSLLELMIAVRKLGIEPILVCPAGPLAQEAARAHITFAEWSARPLKPSKRLSDWFTALPVLIRAWKELRLNVRKFQPGILHANSMQAMIWTGPAGWRHGCPVVWHWRDFYKYQLAARLLARLANVIVATSNATMKFAANQLGPLARRLVTIKNGVADLPPRSTDSLRSKAGFPAGAPLIVMAGQSVPRKGHAVLLEALAELAKTRPAPRARLFCSELSAEQAEYTEQLIRRTKSLGCEGFVEITPEIEQMAPALYAADIVVVPSLSEPFGRIAVEAMLAERPVIASGIDGLKEIVVDGETGILVPPSDPALLAAALVRMLDDPDLWASRGAAARTRALRLFGIPRVAGQMVSLYRTIQSGAAIHPADRVLK